MRDKCGKSKYVETWWMLGGLPTTPEQDMACLFLEQSGLGLRFCIDYGYENAVEIASRHGWWIVSGVVN